MLKHISFLSFSKNLFEKIRAYLAFGNSGSKALPIHYNSKVHPLGGRGGAKKKGINYETFVILGGWIWGGLRLGHVLSANNKPRF